MSERKNLL
ncbi:hypothetical protein LINPERHAP2_LOCUS20546 [Linum perenne]